MGSVSQIQAQNSLNEFTDKAVLVLPDASYIQGKDKVLEHFKIGPMPIEDSKEIFKTAAHRFYDYGMNSFTSNGVNYKEIVITTQGDDQKRDFVFQSESSSAQLDKEGLDKAREKWVALCNANDSKLLIDQLYHDPTVYYNSGRSPITDKEALAREYSYMNNPKYELFLTPIHTEPVTQDLAYEIGQCSGSYPGKYIIIWKKHPKFGWQVLVDSNI